jgi:hypothetical protein
MSELQFMEVVRGIYLADSMHLAVSKLVQYVEFLLHWFVLSRN